MSSQAATSQPLAEILGSQALAHLPPSSEAHVTAVTGEPVDAQRLKALGICLGRRVQLVKSGDPLVVRVLGARVGLSRRLAQGIFVEQI